MSTDPSAANVPALPIDLSAAFPSFPASPVAASLDAELLELVLRAGAALRRRDAAEAAFAAASANVDAPHLPQALIWRARDRELFPKIDCLIGDALTLLDVQVLRAVREAMHALARIMGDLPSRDVMEALGRAADIDTAAALYFEALDAARQAAGFPQAAAEFERLDAELARLWREIAFTPARTLLGVLAKLEAVAAPIAASPLRPNDFPERCSADDVARMAAGDLAAVFTAADHARIP